MAKIISKALGTPEPIGEEENWIEDECRNIELVIPEYDPSAPDYDWEKDRERDEKLAQLEHSFFELKEIELADAERENWDIKRA